MTASPSHPFGQRPSVGYLLLWYLGVGALLCLLPEWKFRVPLWHLSHRDVAGVAMLAAAFVSSIVLSYVIARIFGRRHVLFMLAATMASFSLVLVTMLLTQSAFSRSITALAFAISAVLVPLPYLLPAWRFVRGAALVGLAAGFVGGHVWVAATAPTNAPTLTALHLHSEYYGLDVETLTNSFPHSLVRGGALSQVGERYVLVTGDGHLYTFSLGTPGKAQAFAPLPYRVPINGDAFAKVSGRPWGTIVNESVVAEGQTEPGPEVLHNEWFRVYGLLTQVVGDRLRIFTTHNYWHDEGRCWTERISTFEGPTAAVLDGTAKVQWRTLFETTPCLPIEGEARRHGIPFVGYFGGGRIVQHDARTLLFSVGDFGFDGVAAPATVSQDPAVSYGKALLIDIADGHSKNFTIGLRNPEGLYQAPDGTVWESEHGPQGGDEVNLLHEGGNYGWPFATYGTDYGAFKWPLNRHEGEHDGFDAPVFSWVPSIGVSNLVVPQKSLFPLWRGDLLIASLKARTLFRARVRLGRVMYLESIEIGSRIRDVIEAADGRIVLLTDDDTVVSLQPSVATDGEGVFADKCSGCHQSALISANRIGPNLFGVVDRPVASLDSYPDYSPSLRKLGGTWSRARLDQFLSGPRKLVPGTAMESDGLPDAKERAAVIQYLGTLTSD